MIFDQLLCTISLKKKDLVMIGFTCYWISVKIDCKSILSLDALKKLFEIEITLDSVCEMELKIMNVIRLEANFPTSKFFLRMFLLDYNANDLVVELTRSFAEYTLANFEFFDFLPSVIAQSILIISFLLIKHYDACFEIVKFCSCKKKVQNCSKILMSHGKNIIEARIQNQQSNKEI